MTSLDVERDGAVERGDLAERLVRRFLLVCENPRTRDRAVRLVQGSVADAGAGRRFYALVNRLVVLPVLRTSRVRTSAVRVEVVGAQLIGVAMLRYVLEVEPIASLDVEELVPVLTPPLRAALRGDGRVDLQRTTTTLADTTNPRLPEDRSGERHWTRASRAAHVSPS